MATEKFNSLDFDKIRNNIKIFLSTKTEFVDHNFEGSTWALILDALAFSAHYTGVYSNMALSETFLDSAQLRSSVVSRAKELGYIPKQSTASSAKINLTTASITGQTIIIPAGTTFNATIDAIGYIFTTLVNYTMSETSPGNYSVDIDVTQGFGDNLSYTVINAALDEYIIYDKNVDVNSLKVKVNGVDYVAENKFVNLDGTNKVYFIEETLNEKLKIRFGDSVLGFKPSAGDVITINWLSTSAEKANGVKIFELKNTINGILPANWVITTISNATGGAAKDSIDKIKFLAPKIYSSQNRLVTVDDYKGLLLNNFPNIKSVNVWGGEENIPALFGKVFVSIVTSGSGGNVFGTLTAQDKINFINFMNTYKIVSIIPELIDPNFVLVDINAIVTYDTKLTSSTGTTLAGLIKTKIDDYFLNNLQIFNGTLRLSKLLSTIDAVDKSILDSLISLKLVKVHTVPATNIPNTLELDFSRNEIKPGTFVSNIFNIGDLYTDDGNGVVLLNGVSAGNINYTTGKVIINSVNFAPNDILTFKAEPINFNIASTQLSILDKGSIAVAMNGVA